MSRARTLSETTNVYTSSQAKALVRDAGYLHELRRRMEADPIGRANVPPEIVTSLLDALDAARVSNLHNLAVAKAATQ